MVRRLRFVGTNSGNSGCPMLYEDPDSDQILVQGEAAVAKVTDELPALIESTFATVRHRTKVTKGPGPRAAGLPMAFNLHPVRPGPLARGQREPATAA